MKRAQFRILYHEFLLRVVDLELLSAHAQGDSGRILGQFAALLILCSSLFALGVLGLGDVRIPRAALLIAAWGPEHFLIATTMLVVGLFAVLSWDATFPDQRDLLVLAPLPIHTRTVFLAKVAASATALGLAVVALDGLPSLAWTLATAPAGSILDLVLSPAVYRAYAAYVITMTAAGGFVFGCVLCTQGLAAQLLPRRYFLRVSAVLQMVAFCLIVSVYFLQPTLTTPQALASAQNQGALTWLPSYWFLGLLQQLNGSMHPALAALARRAWLGLTGTGCGTVVVYVLSYYRTLRKIIEEPEITPGSRRGGWLPRFGSAFTTAVTHFSLRTLVRSRQHRLILAFYFGIGFAITILFVKTPIARLHLATASANNFWQEVSGPLPASSIVMVSVWIAGTRVVFSMPVDLRANWIFRLSPIAGAPVCLGARRRALVVLALAPAWAASIALFLPIWPWQAAAAHVMILGLFGAVLTEFCLGGTQKIPFTCSYLPGRSNFHITFWMCIGLLMTLVSKGAALERQALGDVALWSRIVAILAVILAAARWRNASEARAAGAELRFEEEMPPVISGLGLDRDGAFVSDAASSGHGGT